MKQFLIEYDRSCSAPAAVSTFEDTAVALAQHRDREGQRRPEVEVVLLFAESIDDLKITHARYFMTTDEHDRQIERMAEGLRVPA